MSLRRNSLSTSTQTNTLEAKVMMAGRTAAQIHQAHQASDAKTRANAQQAEAAEKAYKKIASKLAKKAGHKSVRAYSAALKKKGANIVDKVNEYVAKRAKKTGKTPTQIVQQIINKSK